LIRIGSGSKAKAFEQGASLHEIEFEKANEPVKPVTTDSAVSGELSSGNPTGL